MAGMAFAMSVSTDASATGAPSLMHVTDAPSPVPVIVCASRRDGFFYLVFPTQTPFL